MRGLPAMEDDWRWHDPAHSTTRRRSMPPSTASGDTGSRARRCGPCRRVWVSMHPASTMPSATSGNCSSDRSSDTPRRQCAPGWRALELEPSPSAALCRIFFQGTIRALARRSGATGLPDRQLGHRGGAARCRYRSSAIAGYFAELEELHARPDQGGPRRRAKCRMRSMRAIPADAAGLLVASARAGPNRRRACTTGRHRAAGAGHSRLRQRTRRRTNGGDRIRGQT